MGLQWFIWYVLTNVESINLLLLFSIKHTTEWTWNMNIMYMNNIRSRFGSVLSDWEFQFIYKIRAFLVAPLVKNLWGMQETQVQFLGGKIPWRRDRLPTPAFWGFPGGSDGKESACSAGDLGSSLGWEDPLEKGKATHSNILAWRILLPVLAWRIPWMV